MVSAMDFDSIRRGSTPRPLIRKNAKIHRKGKKKWQEQILQQTRS